MIRAVVDTNVWISALLNPAGHPARILDAFAAGDFVAVVPHAVLDELRAVLRRPRISRRIGLTGEDIDEFVQLIAERAEVVATGARRFGCRDPKDEALLEAAVIAGANLLITRDDDLKGDADLLERMRQADVAIISVATFLRLL